MTYSPNSARRCGLIRYEIRKGMRMRPEGCTVTGDPYVTIEEACASIRSERIATKN